MIFNLNMIEDKWLEEKYETAMSELGKFFRVNWNENRPRIIILPDRKTIDKYKTRSTPEWLVGFGNGGCRSIFLLDRKNLETESSHKYTEEYYSELLKHELCHIFVSRLAKDQYKPLWLIEGVCVYVSGQIKRQKRPEELSHFLSSWSKVGPGTYSESGFAVEFLVRKYGKEKLFAILKRLSENPDEEKFKKIFKEIYGVKLEYELFNG